MIRRIASPLGALSLSAALLTACSFGGSDTPSTAQSSSESTPAPQAYQGSFDGYVTSVSGSVIRVVPRTALDETLELRFTEDSDLRLWVALSGSGLDPVSADVAAISPGSRISGEASDGVVSRADAEDVPTDCSVSYGPLLASTPASLSLQSPTGPVSILVPGTVTVVERTRPMYESRIVSDLTTVATGSSVFAVSCAGSLAHVELVR